MDSDVSFVKDRSFNIELGNSFRKRSGYSLHTLRYDFKPASVDLNQEGQVHLGDGNEVTITLPHLQGAKTLNTRYKGSKKPALKECVLIFNPQNSTFTLEKISSQIQVKKTRSSDIRSAPMPTVLPSAKVPKIMPSKKSTTSKSSKQSEVKRIEEEKPSEQQYPPIPAQVSHPVEHYTATNPLVTSNLSLSSSEDDSSSSGSSSSDEDSSASSAEEATESKNPTAGESQLQRDLLLSESDSDSD